MAMDRASGAGLNRVEAMSAAGRGEGVKAARGPVPRACSKRRGHQRGAGGYRTG